MIYFQDGWCEALKKPQEAPECKTAPFGSLEQKRAVWRAGWGPLNLGGLLFGCGGIRFELNVVVWMLYALLIASNICNRWQYFEKKSSGPESWETQDHYKYFVWLWRAWKLLLSLVNIFPGNAAMCDVCNMISNICMISCVDVDE